jgi:hypothetical protein
LDLIEYYNKAIAKSARNPLTSLLPASLPPISLPPTSLLHAFKPLISLPLAAFKKFDYYYTSTSLKRQADRIAV